MNNPSTLLPGGRSAKAWAISIVAVLAVALSGCADAPGAVAASVVRVVDGDTIVVNVDSEEQTVRLLNVDTPETKHPEKPVECLGLEATTYLEETLPPGTTVGLDFDVERLDQYGRTLAAVFTEDETLVNAEIARQGLGVAVLFEPNDKYYGAVKDAQAEAESQQRGFYDAGEECTVPAAVDQAVQDLTEAIEAPVGVTSDSAAAAATALVAALAAAESLDAAFNAGKASAHWAAITGDQAAALSGALIATISTGKDRLAVVEAEVERLEQAEAEAAAAKKAEQERKAAKAKAEKERKAAAAAQKAAEQAAEAEAERLRNLPPTPAPYEGPEYGPFVPLVPPQPPADVHVPYVPPVPAPGTAPEPAPAPEQGVQNPYPGYTGPRCYAPGGQTWKPCP